MLTKFTWLKGRLRQKRCSDASATVRCSLRTEVHVGKQRCRLSHRRNDDRGRAIEICLRRRGRNRRPSFTIRCSSGPRGRDGCRGGWPIGRTSSRRFRPIGGVGGFVVGAASWRRFLGILQGGMVQEQLLLTRGWLGVFGQSFILFYFILVLTQANSSSYHLSIQITSSCRIIKVRRIWCSFKLYVVISCTITPQTLNPWSWTLYNQLDMPPCRRYWHVCFLCNMRSNANDSSWLNFEYSFAKL